MLRVVRYPEYTYLLVIDALPTPSIIADYYPVEIYSLNVECVIDFPYE